MDFSKFWNWIDDRQVDKHVASAIIMLGTVKVLSWAMVFAHDNPTRPGMDVAAIIAAVEAPYMALQSFALNFYFSSRPKT